MKKVWKSIEEYKTDSDKIENLENCLEFAVRSMGLYSAPELIEFNQKNLAICLMYLGLEDKAEIFFDLSKIKKIDIEKEARKLGMK